MGDWLEPLPSVAGMHLTATFRRGGLRLERELIDRAKEAGLGLVGEGLRRLCACIAR